MSLNELKKWVWPAALGIALLIGFAVPHSDVGGNAVALVAMHGVLAAIAWAVHPSPTDDRTRVLLWVGFGFLFLLLLLSLPLSIPQITHGGGGLVDRSSLWLELIKLSGIGAAFVFSYRISSAEDVGKRALDTIIFVVSAWAFISLVMTFVDPGGIYGVAKFGGSRLTGAFSSPNSAGTLFGSIFVLSCGRLISRFLALTSGNVLEKIDLRFIVCSSFCLAALVLSQSRGAIFASLICVIVMAAMMFWRHASFTQTIGAAVLALASLLWAFGARLPAVLSRMGDVGTDAQSRTTLFSVHFEAALRHPWFGIGLGGFDTFNETLVEPGNYLILYPIRSAHNVYLQWFEETGVTGLLIIGLLNVMVLVPMLINIGKRQSIGGRLLSIVFFYAVFLIHGITDFAFQEPSLAICASSILGIGLALATSPRKKSSRHSADNSKISRKVQIPRTPSK